MKKFSLLWTLFVLFLFTTVIDAETVLTQSVDYVGMNGQRMMGVGVEERGGMLNFYQWQNGILLDETTLTTGRNIMNPQIVLNSNGQKVVSYLKESNDVLRLYLLIFHDGRWEKVTQPVDQRETASVGLHDLCISNDSVYLAYTQGDELAIVKYDLQSKNSQPIYQENLSNKRLLTLTVTRMGSDPVFAYTYENQGQIRLQIARINNSGVADWQYTADQVNGYDLIGNDQHLYLVHDQKVGQGSKVSFYENIYGEYRLLSQFQREDSAPFGVKLMLTDEAVNLVYRDNGIASPYDLYVRKLINQSLGSPEWLPIAGRWAELNNIRDNIQSVDSSHLCLVSKEFKPIVSKQKPDFLMIDLQKAVPETVWASSKTQNSVSKRLIEIPTQPQTQELSITPGGVVTDSLGNVYILDLSVGKVCKIDANNPTSTYWKASAMNDYEFVDVAVNAKKELYVVDRDNHRVVVFDATGKFLKYWGNPGHGEGQFFRPASIAFDSKENLYILDAGNQRVQKFDPAGRMTAEWGGWGSNSGQFRDPSSLVIDENDQVYVVDTGNHRIQMFTSDGDFVKQLGRFGRDAGQMMEPVDLAIQGGKMYVADQGNNRVQVFDLNLQYIFEFGVKGSGSGQINKLTHLHLDRDGKIYLTDEGNQKVLRLSNNLTLLNEWYGQDQRDYFELLNSWGTLGNLTYYLDVEHQQFQSELKQELKLSDPTKRILTGWAEYLNYIYFTDVLNHTIVQYTNDGQFVRTIGQYGNQPGEFNHPQGIDVDSAGNMYVADTGNHRIQIFNAAGQYIKEWGSYGLQNEKFIAPMSVSCQGENILIVDQGTNRVQSLNSKGVHNRTWFGFGDAQGQIPLHEYLNMAVVSNATKTSSLMTTNTILSSSNFGLSNDDYPRKTKVWYPVYTTAEQECSYVIDLLPDTTSFNTASGHFESIEKGGVTGKYYLHIKEVIHSIDEYGNSTTEYGDVYHYYAFIDNTAPYITINNVIYSPTPSSAQSAELSWFTGDDLYESEDSRSYRFMVTDTPSAQWTATQWDSWNELTYSSTATSTLVTGYTGKKYISIQARDYAGNISSIKETSFVLDNEAPRIITCNIVKNNGNLQVTIQSTDNVTDATNVKYRYMVNGSYSTALTGLYMEGSSFTTTYTEDDVYLHIQLQDGAGNESAVYRYRLDEVEPAIAIFGLSNYDVPVKSHTWTWTGVDRQGSSNLTYRYSFSTAPEATITTEFTAATSALVPEQNGKVYINVQARDAMGNLSPVYSNYVNMDNTAPIITSIKLSKYFTESGAMLKLTGLTSESMSARANLKFRYCMDSNPTTTPTGLYTILQTAVPLPEGVSYVHMQVIDEAGNESAVYHEEIDMIAPTISGLSNQETPVKSYTWTWTGQDDRSRVSYQYSFTMTPEPMFLPGNTYATTATVPIQNGKVYFNIQARDVVGNLSPVYCYYVNMDNTAPVVNGCLMVSDTDGSLKFTPSGSDAMSPTENLKYRFSIDNSQTTIPTGTYITGPSFNVPFPEGIAYVHIQAMDEAGNESIVYHIPVNTDAPIITSLSNYDVPVKEHTWTWSGVDSLGSSNLTYRFSFTPVPETTITTAFTTATTATVTAQSGKVYINLQAQDARGNLSPVYNYYVIMDNTRPYISSVGNNKENGVTTILITRVIASDNISASGKIKIRYSIDSNSIATPTGAYSTTTGTEIRTPFPEGVAYLHVQAIDEAGNESNVFHVNIDTIAPTISVLTNYDVPVKSHTWEWSGADDRVGLLSYRYSFTMTPATTITDPFRQATSAVVPLQDGKIYFNIQVKDAFDNLSPVYNYYVNMDNTAPTIDDCTLVKDTDGSLHFTPFASDAMSSGENLKYRFSIDGIADTNPIGAYTTGSSFNVPFPGELAYLHLQVMDQAGNESVVYHVQVDTEPPAMNPLANYDVPVKSHTWTWTGMDNQAAPLHYRYSFTTTPETTVTTGLTTATTAVVPMPDGKIYINIQAVDDIGNSSPVYNYYVKMDNTAPTIAGCIFAIDTDGRLELTPNTIDAMSPEANLKYRFSIDGNADTTPTGTYVTGSTFTAPLPTGMAYVHLQAIDEAGNESSVYHGLIVLDCEPPVISLASVPTKPERTWTWRWSASDNMDEPGEIEFCYAVSTSAIPSFTTGYAKVYETTVTGPDGTYYLHLKARDQLHNESPVVTRQVILDNTAPTFNTAALIWSGDRSDMNSYIFKSPISLTIPVSAYQDAHEVTVHYSLDGAAEQTYGSLPIAITTEGHHTLAIRLVDTAGNITENTLSVTVDQTAPIVTQVNSSVFAANTWSKQSSGTLVVDANDNLSQIKEYRYIVNSQERDEPVSVKNLFSTTNTISLSNLTNGIHYLHIQPVDFAGNMGNSFTYAIQIDTTTPAAPIIASDTHSTSEAKPATTAHFTWSTPETAGPLGVKEYVFKLKRTSGGAETIVEEGTTLSLEKWFNNLLPTGANESYSFSVFATNLAGSNSVTTTFTFQVSTPVTSTVLAVNSSTHPGTTEYYNTSLARFSWNNPWTDTTVATQYSYQLRKEGEVVDGNAWTSVTGQSLEKTVTDSGKYIFYLKAVHGTEVKSAQKVISVDFERPLTSDFYLNPNLTNRSVSIYWGAVSDAFSGIREIKTKIIADGIDLGWKKIAATAQETTYTGLRSNLSYTLIVAIMDQAGNMHQMSASFKLGELVNYDVAQPFRDMLGPWTIEGLKRGQSIESAKVMVDGYNFKVLEAGIYVSKTELPFTEYANDILMNPNIAYQIQFGENVFTGKGIRLDANGLKLLSIAWATPSLLWTNQLNQIDEANKEFTFSEVTLSPTPGQIVGSYSATRDIKFTAGWPITLSTVVLNNAGLNMSGQVDLTSLSYIQQPLTVSNLRFTDQAFTSGNLQTGYPINLGSSSITVEESSLMNGYIHVKSGYFTFMVGETIHKVQLRNFEINTMGIITQRPDYYSEPFSYTMGNVTYQFAANKVTLTDGELSMTDGLATVAGTNESILVENVKLSTNQENLIQPSPSFMYLEKYVEGIRIEALAGYQEGNYIVFSEGAITLPLSDEEGASRILNVSNIKYNVTNSAWDFSQMSIANPVFGFNNLAYVEIQSIRTVADGLDFDGNVTMMDHLPVGLANSVYVIQDLVMNGTEGVKLFTVKVDPAANPLKLYNTYQFTTNLLQFRLDGKVNSIYFTGCQVEYIGAMASKLSAFNRPATLNICEIASNGEITKFDSALRNLTFNFAGLQVNLSTRDIGDQTITFGGTVTLPDTLPGSFRSLTLQIHELQMDHTTGAILNFVAYQENPVPIQVGEWSFALYSVGISETEIQFSAGIQIPGTILPALEGKYIDINQFVLNRETGGIIAFDVNVPLDFSFSIGSGFQVSANHLEVSLSEGRLENLALGFRYAGLQLPADLGGGVVSVSGLKVTADGQISYSSINMSGQLLKYKNVIDISIQNATFDSTGLSVKGTLTLGSIFPVGLKDQVFTISDFHMTNARVDRFAVSTANLPPIQIFNALEFTPGTITITDMGVKMENGLIKFIGDAATKITNQAVTLNSFSVDYSGKVTLNAAFGNFSFNTAAGSVYVNSINFTESKITFAGSLTLPAALPGNLSSLRLNVTNLEVTYQGNVTNFNLTVNTPHYFNIGLVKFELSSFTVGTTGIGMAGNITLPSTFPGGLANQKVSFKEVSMGYNGKLISSDIECAEINFAIGNLMNGKLSGFGLEVVMGEPKLVATKLDLTLKSPLSGGISFTNMSLSTTGDFRATAQPTANFKIPLAGFELNFTAPSFANGEVQISKAQLILPASLGKGSFSVTNVRIHPTEGVKVGAGELSVKIPEFKVGQVGLQQAVLYLKTGTQYSFEGQCKAQVPGIGQFAARVKLVSSSPKNKSGIEAISLSFQSTSVGLPLGTTGLFINGVYGEFADGPIPSNSSDVVKRIGDGMRFNLGIYLRDMSGGFTGNTGFWVNITNTNSAVTGQVGLLNNLVSANAYASITNHFKDFYASAQIKVLNCIEGSASFHLWSQRSKTYLTGTSSVRFKLNKGQVVNTWLVKIPSRDWWTPTIGTEFGDFKNNVKGVKGYVSVPVFGQVGLFIGNIGFKVGGVDKYVLIDRATTQFAHVVLTPEEQLMGLSAVDPGLNNFVIDNREYVKVNVPGSKQFASMGAQLASATPEQLNSYFVKSTERLVFAVGFKTGDPEIVAIDPAGTAYDKNTPGVEYSKEVGQVVLSIPNPTPGAWHLELNNAEGIEYQVVVLGTTPKPEMTFLPASQVGVQSEGEFQISGYGGVFSGKTCYVDLYYDTDNQGFDGVLIAEHIPVSNGNINYNWNLSKVPAGQYYIYSKIYDEDPDGSEAMPPALMYSDTPVTINPRSIAAPSQMKAVKVGEEVHMDWPVSDNPDVAGYKVYYGTEMGVYPHCTDVGHLTETMLPVLEGTTMYVGVSSYDLNGAESDKTEIAVNLDVPQLTTFHMQNVQIDQAIEALIGESKTVELPYTTVMGDVAEGEQFIASLSGLPTGVNVIFDQQVYELYNSPQVIRMTLMAEPKTVKVTNELGETLTEILAATPGTTEVTLTLTSTSNPALVFTQPFNLVVKHPQPRVNQVFPVEAINNLPREITVRGENFQPNARVTLGATELVTQYLDSFTLTATVPQGMEAGLKGITVVNPDGQMGDKLNVFTVLKPEYVILPLQPMVTVRRGETAQLYFTLGGRYEFMGQVELRVNTIPTDFTVTAVQPLASVGGDAAFAVTVGETVAPGDYTLSFASDADHSENVTVHVVDGDLQPQITALSKPFGFANDTIVVYGSGFGAAGTLTLNNMTVATVDWKPNRIEFVLPEGAQSGYIVVNANGIQSAPRYFTVKVKEYTVIYPQQITIRRGETVPVTIAVIGYSDPIQFGVNNPAVGLNWQFTNPSTGVVPNYDLLGTLTASTTMERGSYTIELTANVGDKRFPITVIVETAEIANAGLAEGRVQVPYNDWIDVQNGIAPYQFTLIEGSLPTGLTLEGDGDITGLPQEIGIYTFTVQVEDSTHAVSRKELQIQVTRDEWSMVGHDGQGSSYTPQPGPATNEFGELIALPQTPDLLLSSDQRIIVGQGNFVNLYTKSGTLVKTLDLTEPVIDGVTLMEQYVFLTASGKLVRYQPNTDPVKDVPVVMVTGFTPKYLYLYRDQVMVTDGAMIQLWDLNTLQPKGEFTLTTPANSAVKGVLFNGKYYYVSAANELLNVELATQQESLKVPYTDTISRITVMKEKLIILTAMGQVHEFFPQTLSGRLWHDFGEPMQFVVPFAEGVVVGNAAKAVTLVDENKEPAASVQGDFQQLLVAGNRLYAAGNEAITAYKLAGLEQVWNASVTGVNTLMVCNGRLYAATSTSLFVFDGPNNAAVPETSIATKPTLNNDWYSENVTVYLYATDQDNEVAGIYYSLNGATATQYTDPFVLDQDGVHVLRSYAVDEAGLVGSVTEATVKLDFTGPEVTIIPLEADGTSQRFEIRATDTLSGVDYVRVKIGSAPSVDYTGPITLPVGVYTVSYHALDNVGNISLIYKVQITVIGTVGSAPIIEVLQVSSIPE